MEHEIQEHDLLPPAEGLGGKRKGLELNPNQKVMLVNWAKSAEYDVFLTLSEGIIEQQETAHFQVWKDKESFERTGLVAVAMRLFFERLQKEVNHQLDEFSGELEFARTQEEVEQTSPEEMIQRSL